MISDQRGVHRSKSSTVILPNSGTSACTIPYVTAMTRATCAVRTNHFGSFMRRGAQPGENVTCFRRIDDERATNLCNACKLVEHACQRVVVEMFGEIRCNYHIGRAIAQWQLRGVRQ